MIYALYIAIPSKLRLIIEDAVDFNKIIQNFVFIISHILSHNYLCL